MVPIRRIKPRLVIHDPAHAFIQLSLPGVAKIGLRDRANVRAHLSKRQISLLSSCSAIHNCHKWLALGR